MAYSLNRAQVIGNVTRDPDVKQTPQGQFVASFGVATSYSWTDASGQKQEKTEFHNIVAWRKLAEIIKQYVKKGNKIFIEGKLQTRDWEGEDGVKRYRTEIVADNMIMLGGRSGGSDIPVSVGQDRVPAGIEVGTAEAAPMAATTGVAPAADTAKTPAVVQEDDITVEDLPF
ncbi:single-stranded DNA-binding protein [Patescibacteria group bacterium]|nr:single-stranded DNA-binding protein [Patescibacteria group bacterium]